MITKSKFRLMRNGNVNRTRKYEGRKQFDFKIVNVYDSFNNNEINLIDYLKTLRYKFISI